MRSKSAPVELAFISPDSARDAAALAIAAINVAIGRPLQKGSQLPPPASTAAADKLQDPAAKTATSKLASKPKKKTTGSSFWGGGSSKSRQRESRASNLSSFSSLSGLSSNATGGDQLSGEVVVDESQEIG